MFTSIKLLCMLKVELELFIRILVGKIFSEYGDACVAKRCLFSHVISFRLDLSQLSMLCAVQKAMAWTVTMGFTPKAVGKTLVSPTKRPSTSQASQVGSTLEVAGSTPIRHVPI